jgi:pimeloyl-ACP methyl ester carboxylesterase
MRDNKLPSAQGGAGPLGRRKEERMDIEESWVGEAPAQSRVRRYPGRSGDSANPRVVLVHGGSHTSGCWIETPDGRPGWAAQFADAGYDVYALDYIDIGKPYSVVDRTPQEVIDSLVTLLRTIGPAVLVGHSLGGGLAIKATETAPEWVDAVVLAAPASVEALNQAVLKAEPGVLATMPAEVGLARLANAAKFPSSHRDEWLRSLVAYSPHLRNAGSGATPEFRIDRERIDVWQDRPTLMLLAEDDLTVSLATGRTTAEAMRIAPVVLGRDWNLADHGHMFIVELESEQIAARVIDWLTEHRPAARGRREDA